MCALFFVIGSTLGSLCGVVFMCLMQINRINHREDEGNAEKKRSDTLPS